MKKTIFEGSATALITPTTPDGVDYQALKRLIDWQIDNGADALVICGTTGESSTLTDAEHKEVLRYSAEVVNKRIPIIAGTGSNETDYAIELTRWADKCGYDAALVVTPYYNKATQKGLYLMYQMLAECSNCPLVLYNVPSRTGVNIEPKTYAMLADHPNIAAIKEANGNMSAIIETMSYVKGKLDIYSGNDDQITPIMACGGKGVISVLANLMPGQTSRIVKSFLEGNTRESLDLQAKYLPLIQMLFCEVNPIPVKSAMAAMGFCEEYLRLPLTVMEDGHKEKMFAEMRKLGLIK